MPRLGEHPQRDGVHRDPGQPDQAEGEQPRQSLLPGGAGGPLDLLAQHHQPQPQQVVGEAQALLGGGLALIGQPGTEDERHLGDPQPRLAHRDLEQDLEAGRVQPRRVHRGQPDGEEARHRIRQPAEPAREQRLGQRGGEAGNRAPEAAGQPVRGSGALVAGGRDQIQFAGLPDRDQLGRQLRRMLQVAVHHDGPGAACHPQSLGDRRTESAMPLAGGPMQQPDRQPRGAGDRPDHVRRGIVAVVDEQHLRRRVADSRFQPLQQRLDVSRLVAGWHDNGEPSGFVYPDGE